MRRFIQGLMAALSLLGILMTHLDAQAQAAPQIISVAHSSMPVGGGQIINGTGFGNAQGNSTLTLNGTQIVPWYWTDSQLNVTIPTTTTPGLATLQVTTAGGASNNFNFTVTSPPTINSISPASGTVGTQVTLTGANFGATQGSSTLSLGPAATITTWSDTQIVFNVPQGATPGQQTIWLFVDSVAATENFTVNSQASPTITTMSPASGPTGTQVTIIGSGFGSIQGTNTLTFNGVAATVASWTDTSISASVPPGATSGNVVVTVGGQASNGLPFTIGGFLSGTVSPTVTSVTLTSPNAIDWAHWGTSSDFPLVTSVGFLSDFSLIGATTPIQFSDGEIEYSWTDGFQLGVANRTTTGVSVTGAGNGFHLSIPADVVPQTLLLYVGDWEAQGQLTASLSDNSAPSFVDSSVDIVAANGDHHTNGTYTLTFQATQPGQTLNIDYILETDHGAASGLAGYVSLQSAVLLPAQASVALTSPTNGQTLTSPSDVPVTVSASQIGGAISSVSFLSDGQDVFDAATTPYNFTLASPSPGDHLLTATATNSQGLSTTSAPVLITEVGTGGFLTASVDSPASVDLSAGASDWVHWGSSIPDRKAGINPEISDFKTLADGSAHSIDAASLGGVNYSWSSGVPTDSQIGTATQMKMQAFKNGFTLTIPADTTLRTLKLYLASGYGESTLRVSLSDGSAAPFVQAFSTPNNFSEKGYTIQFQAASSGQKITLTDQVTRDDGFAYVALESVSVLDQNAPHIDSVTPITVPPGGQPITSAPGSQIVVTGTNFGGAQGNAAISLNGVAMNVISWSDSSITAVIPLVQSGPVVVSRGLANSNGVAFVVILPPPPVISFISPSAGVAGSVVTIFGSNFVSSQNNSTVTFNGLAATPSFWSDTQIVVPAPAGVHSGPVVVTTASGPSNGVQFTFTPAIRFAAQAIYVTPDETSLVVAASAKLSVSDAAGNVVTDATWSVDESTIATITSDTTPGAAILQALQPGEVTITATSALGTAQAKAMIYLPGSTPVGTPAWSFYPQTQNGGFADGIKARRNTPDDPYLYFTSFETATAIVDALDESGHSKWKVTLNPHPGNDFIFPIVSAGTNDGGILTMMGECCGDNDNFNTLYRYGPDGKPKWTYTTPTNVTFEPTIGPDGTIYFWSEGDDTNNHDSPLIALDDGTGTEKFRYRGGLPSSRSVISSEQPDTTNPDGTAVTSTNPWQPCAAYFSAARPINVPLPVGGAGENSIQPIVGTDGNLYVMETGENVAYSYSHCALTKIFVPPGAPPADPAYFVSALDGQMQYSASVGIAQITPAGAVQHLPVNSVSWSGEATLGGFVGGWGFDKGASQLPQAFFRRIAPDSNGGLLLAWGGRSSTANDPQQLVLSRLLDGSPVYTVPLPADGEISSNDQGTAFITSRGLSITAVDVASGIPKWSTSSLAALAATDNGGIIHVNAQGTQFVDMNGTPSPTVEGVYPDSYLDPSLFLVEGDFGSRQVVDTSLAGTSLDDEISAGFPVDFDGNSGQQKQPEFKPVQADACSGYDDSLQPTALVLPFAATAGAQRTTQERTDSQKVVRMHYPDWKNIDLKSNDIAVFTITPDHLTGVDTDVTFESVGLPEMTTFKPDGTIDVPSAPRWLKFINRVTQTEVGRVLVDVKQNKKFAVAPYSVSELNGKLKPTSVPTQGVLQNELTRIFPKQTGITLTVSPIKAISVHYNLNAAAGSKALTFPDSEQKQDEEQEIVKATVADFALNQLLVFYVHAFDQTPPTHPDGFTFRNPKLSESGHATINGPTLVRDPEVSQDPHVIFIHNSRQNVTAHELGHYLGSPDIVDADKTNELMFGQAAADHPDPCRIRKREWDRMNPPGTSQ